MVEALRPVEKNVDLLRKSTKMQDFIYSMAEYIHVETSQLDHLVGRLQDKFNTQLDIEEAFVETSEKVYADDGLPTGEKRPVDEETAKAKKKQQKIIWQDLGLPVGFLKNLRKKMKELE